MLLLSTQLGCTLVLPVKLDSCGLEHGWNSAREAHKVFS
jgi:hypothetical protein